ncbi:MATE family efflux transporter, partial [Treponema endosymbiont of Eucomonympha sp.]|uniref:MATE family efflux transporter n=1 Tax=Treponema endosymbiont of Eucomonympha sp. TaxID=1580831 RepID=UPI0027D3294E
MQGSLGVPNGGDTALSGLHLQGSVMFLFPLPVFGINQGAQPILGYNYGARQFKRVKKTYLYAVAAATSVCLVGFILAEAFPGSLVSIFAPDGDPKLVSFAIWTIRVALILLPVVGFQVVSSNVFVVTGRPKTAIFLSMLRQCVLLIPCILLFGRLWKLKGIVAAAPVADACSSVFT